MSWHRALAASSPAVNCRGALLHVNHAAAFPAVASVRFASSSRPTGPAKGDRVEVKPLASRPKQPLKTVRPSARRPAAAAPAPTPKPTPIGQGHAPNKEARPQDEPASSTTQEQHFGWHKADFQPEGWFVEQRTIYARPNELLWGPKIKHFQWAYILGPIIVINVLAWPDHEKMEQARAELLARHAVAEARGGFTKEELQEEQERMDWRTGRLRRVWDNITDTMDPTRYLIIGAVGLALFTVHRMVTRNVVELRQIRRTPMTAARGLAREGVENKIRVTTSMRDVRMPGVRGIKDFDLADTGVSNLPSGKTTMLGFRAGTHGDYRMDMTMTDKLQEALKDTSPDAPDVVVSMSRIEQVWPTMENPPPKRMFWAPVSNWFEREAQARQRKRNKQ